MKISKLILFLLLFLNNSLFAQLLNIGDVYESRPEKEKYIKSRNNISESFEYLRKVNENDSILKSHQTYDKNGYLLTTVNFSLQKDTLSYEINEYKEKKLVKSIRYFKNKKNNIFSTTISNYYFDEKKNNIEIQISTNNKVIYQRITYDDNGLKKSLKTKWLNKTNFVMTQEYFYSEGKDLIKEKNYWTNGKIFSEVLFQYDDNKNKIRSNRLHDGKKDVISFYSYDKNNNLIESGFKLSNTKKPATYKTKYEYDDNNNVVKKYYTVDDNLKYIYTITYKKFN